MLTGGCDQAWHLGHAGEGPEEMQGNRPTVDRTTGGRGREGKSQPQTKGLSLSCHLSQAQHLDNTTLQSAPYPFPPVSMSGLESQGQANFLAGLV